MSDCYMTYSNITNGIKDSYIKAIYPLHSSHQYRTESKPWPLGGTMELESLLQKACRLMS